VQGFSETGFDDCDFYYCKAPDFYSKSGAFIYGLHLPQGE